MTPERHALARDIFLKAAAVPRSERGDYLVQQCAGDEALRGEVEKLLAYHEQETLASAAPTDASRRSGAQLELNASAETIAAPIGSRAAPVRPTPPLGSGAPLEPGTILGGRYRLASLLGQGGMGAVYRAEDLTLEQPVAIKFLDSRFAERSDWIERFRNEVRLARIVTHPNVCRVFDIGEADGRVFLSMEFVEGEDLAGLIRRDGKLPFEKAVDIARQVCTGLAAAHGAGVLHRDLKPANIMVTRDGHVRLTDFGIAVAAGGKGRELRAGTPAYMAPEQIAGRGVDARSDIYALGLVLYELFSGQPAFSADSLDEYERFHEEEEPKPLSSLVPELEPGVEQLVHWCLRKDPNERPQSALSVAAALPGVDVLAVALAADQLPAPELVASASDAKVRVERRGMLTLIVIAACVALPWLRASSGLPWESPGAKSTEFLRDAARQELAESGAFESFGYCSRAQAVSFLDRFAGANAVGGVTPAEGEVLFWLRTAARPLSPQSAENLVLGNSRVSLLDPPMVGADARAVLLNQSGRLVTQAVGAQPRLGGAPEGAGVVGASLAQSTLRLTALLVTFVCLPFAWRNYHSARGDRAGAVKASALIFGIQLAAWLVGATHVRALGIELTNATVAVLRAFGFASIVMVLYLALEPLARRYWPHLLIGWTRALNFRGRDPLIWQHVLLGLALGSFWALLWTCEWSLVTALGLTPHEPFVMRQAMDRLVGGRVAAASAVQSVVFGLTQGLLFATPLAIARAVLHRPMPAAVVVGLLLLPVLLPRGAHWATSLVFIGGGAIGLGLWAMVRYGLLAIVIAATVTMFLNAAPLGWQQGLRAQGCFTLMLVAGAALVGWRRSYRKTGTSPS